MIDSIISTVKEAEDKAEAVIIAAKQEANATLDGIGATIAKLTDEANKRVDDYKDAFEKRSASREETEYAAANEQAEKEIASIVQNASQKKEAVYEMLKGILCG